MRKWRLSLLRFISRNTLKKSIEQPKRDTKKKHSITPKREYVGEVVAMFM